MNGMTHKNLENLVRMHELHEEAPSKSEFYGLIKSGTLRLRDAMNESLALESRFDLAYNAAHSFSLAALRACGYRTEKRYLVFQCLAHTLELPKAQVRILVDAHRKRNLAEYEGEIDVSQALLDSLITCAREVELRVSKLKL